MLVSPADGLVVGGLDYYAIHRQSCESVRALLPLPDFPDLHACRRDECFPEAGKAMRAWISNAGMYALVMRQSVEQSGRDDSRGGNVLLSSATLHACTPDEGRGQFDVLRACVFEHGRSLDIMGR
eukprot:UN5167